MIIQEGSHIGLPVGVVVDGSPLSRKVLITAANLVHIREGFLIVFILASHVDEARTFQNDIAEWARSSDLHVHFHWLVNREAPHLVELIRDENCGVLVLSAEGITYREEALAELLDRIGCPVLVVR